MAWSVFRLSNVEAGPPGFKLTAERAQSEREILYTIIRDATAQIADADKLDIAAELVAAMDAADAEADPHSRQLYERPVAAAEGVPPS